MGPSPFAYTPTPWGGLFVIQVVITFSTAWPISVLLLLIELFGRSAALRGGGDRKKKNL